MKFINEETLFLIDFVQIFLKDNLKLDLIDEIKKLPVEEIHDKDMHEAIEYIKNNSSESLYDELNYDYVKLFLHPNDFKTFPIASYHMVENKTLVSKITEDIKSEFLEENFILSDSFPYKEDHIVSILEFIKFSENPEQTEKIIKNYLLPWLGDFADAVCKNAQSFVYKRIGCILKTIESRLN